jgi:hypothetical protein
MATCTETQMQLGGIQNSVTEKEPMSLLIMGGYTTQMLSG